MVEQANRQLVIFDTKLVMKKNQGTSDPALKKKLYIINKHSIIRNKRFNFIWILTILTDFIKIIRTKVCVQKNVFFDVCPLKSLGGRDFASKCEI